jgi:hypothetical protein
MNGNSEQANAKMKRDHTEHMGVYLASSGDDSLAGITIL